MHSDQPAPGATSLTEAMEDLHVLLVDDDKDFLTLMDAMLRAIGVA